MGIVLQGERDGKTWETIITSWEGLVSDGAAMDVAQVTEFLKHNPTIAAQLLDGAIERGLACSVTPARMVDSVALLSGRRPPVASGVVRGGVHRLPTIVINRHSLEQRCAALAAGYQIIYCGRGSKWGNYVGKGRKHDDAVAMHKAYVLARPEFIADVKATLTGAACECFCKPKTCHCDVYAEICNA